MNLKEQYNKQGYIISRGVFDSSHQKEWAGECDHLMADPEIMQGNLPRKHMTQGTIIDRLDPATKHSPLFLSLAQDRRILDIIQELWGEPAALLKDKLISKPPGTYGYSIHQDYPYWEWLEIPADELVTVWITIDKATIKNGAIEVFPGKHHARIPGKPDEPRDMDESLIDLSTGELVELEPGDLIVFHSLVPHRSAPNLSASHRRTFMPTYIPVRYGDLRERYYSK